MRKGGKEQTANRRAIITSCPSLFKTVVPKSADQPLSRLFHVLFVCLGSNSPPKTCHRPKNNNNRKERRLGISLALLNNQPAPQPKTQQRWHETEEIPDLGGGGGALGDHFWGLPSPSTSSDPRVRAGDGKGPSIFGNLLREFCQFEKQKMGVSFTRGFGPGNF